MATAKYFNPETSQWEELSVSTLETPRKINGTDFDGSKDITIIENEVVIGDSTPVFPENKLWVSNIQGVGSTPIVVDWPNVANKPSWTQYMPVSTLTGMANKVLSVNLTEDGFEYKTLISSSNANSITYDNPTYPTVESALNKLLYVPLTGSLSGGSVNEIGSTISQIILNWNYNKPVISQSINNGIGVLSVDLRTYTHTNLSISTNTTYTLTSSDGTNTINNSTAISFLHKRYWGTSTSSSITDADILTLSKELSSSRSQSRIFNCSGNEYFWIIYPSSFGLASFKVGGLSFSDMNLEVRTIINGSGANVQLNIYRVNNIQTGSAIIVDVY